jgi:hypothetical protein
MHQWSSSMVMRKRNPLWRGTTGSYLPMLAGGAPGCPRTKDLELRLAGTGRLSSRSWEGRGPPGRALCPEGALPGPAGRRPGARGHPLRHQVLARRGGRATGVGLGRVQASRDALPRGVALVTRHVDASFGDVSISSDADRQRFNLLLALPGLEPRRDVRDGKWRTEQEPLG